MSDVLYKWLNGREATHVAGFRYRLGAWQPEVEGELVACHNGYHLMRPEHLSRWIARDLFVAEYDPETVMECPDKVVVSRCRIVEHLRGWDREALILCAADFAEKVLPIFEARFPDDDRPRKAIEAAEAAGAAWAAGAAGAAAGAAWAAEAAGAAAEAAGAAGAAGAAWAAEAAGAAAEAAGAAWAAEAAGAAGAAGAAEAAGAAAEAAGAAWAAEAAGAAWAAEAAGAAGAAWAAETAECEWQGARILAYARDEVA